MIESSDANKKTFEKMKSRLSISSTQPSYLSSWSIGSLLTARSSHSNSSFSNSSVSDENITSGIDVFSINQVEPDKFPATLTKVALDDAMFRWLVQN